MTPTAEDLEKARKVWERCLVTAWPNHIDQVEREVLLREVAQALQQERKAGLLKGAEIAERFDSDSFKVVTAEYAKFHNGSIAKAIRQEAGNG